MSFGHKLGAKLDEVEYLPVEDHADRARLVVNGLVASLQVDDREPRMRETDPGFDVDTSGVWTPVMQCGNHARQQRPLWDTLVVFWDEPGDSAHWGVLDRQSAKQLRNLAALHS